MEFMFNLPEKSVVLIAGPTASGKSALAINIALANNGVIINADSMQVYQELRVLTARPNIGDEALVPHRLYGHMAGAAEYSVAQWQRECMAEIKKAHEAHQLPIVCGGTGLYFMSLINGLSAVPEISPEVREKWRGFEGDLLAELALRDSVSAAKLNPADRQRLIRALEVVESTGVALPDWQAQAKAAAPLQGMNVIKLHKIMAREELYARADLRFDQMIEQGALDEVKKLPQLHYNQPLMKAIGVPELQAHARGELTLAEAKVLAQTATRQYIKRQLTWARGQMADWSEASPQTLGNLLSEEQEKPHGP
jgi:tRNA dimethylallyltransferase